METCRCAICGRTNNYDLTTYPEQYTPGPFRIDPHNELQDICAECDDEVYDSLQLWEDPEGEEPDEDEK